MSWRDHSNKVIISVFKQHNPKTIDEAKKLLREAYPFGQRAMHPYKIWLSAVNRALKQRFSFPPENQLSINQGLFNQD